MLAQVSSCCFHIKKGRVIRVLVQGLRVILRCFSVESRDINIPPKDVLLVRFKLLLFSLLLVILFNVFVKTGLLLLVLIFTCFFPLFLGVEMLVFLMTEGEGNTERGVVEGASTEERVGASGGIVIVDVLVETEEFKFKLEILFSLEEVLE